MSNEGIIKSEISMVAHSVNFLISHFQFWWGIWHRPPFPKWSLQRHIY